jgi:hypothetical protein
VQVRAGEEWLLVPGIGGKENGFTKGVAHEAAGPLT